MGESILQAFKKENSGRDLLAEIWKIRELDLKFEFPALTIPRQILEALEPLLGASNFHKL